MIPKIVKVDKKDFYYHHGNYRWIVIGKHGSDIVHTFTEAIRYWFWHCGIPAKRCFRKCRKYDKNSEKTRLDIESK